MNGYGYMRQITMKKQIEGRKELSEYYRRDEVIEGYVEKRFNIPLNRVLHRNQVEFINGRIKERGIDKVLEIAPGPARLTAEIEGFKRGYILDINEEMLDLAKKKLEKSGLDKNWEVIRADAFDTGLKDNFTPMIYTFRFIRHFRYKDRKKLYSEMRRLLTDKGCLIFDVPNYGIEKIMRKGKTEKDYPIYDTLWRKKEFIKEMKDNGFVVLEMWSNLKLYYMQAAISRLNRLNLGRVGEMIIYYIDRIGFDRIFDNPKEWLVLCQKE